MKIRSHLRTNFSNLRGIFHLPNHDPNVDPNDDSIDRWVVWHYRYDPDRRERRNMIIAAFDNRRAFMKFFERTNAELDVAKSEGRAEEKERISGTKLKAGYREEINQFRQFRSGPGLIRRVK